MPEPFWIFWNIASEGSKKQKTGIGVPGKHTGALPPITTCHPPPRRRLLYMLKKTRIEDSRRPTTRNLNGACAQAQINHDHSSYFNVRAANIFRIKVY